MDPEQNFEPRPPVENVPAVDTAPELIIPTRRRTRGVPRWVVLLQGTFSLLAGIFLLTAPEASVVVVSRVLGVFWLVSGVASLLTLFTRDSGSTWGWLLLNGVLGIAAGLAVLEHPLLTAMLAASVLVSALGVAGTLLGVSYLFQAVRGGGLGAGLMGVASVLFGLLLLATNTPLLTLAAATLYLGIAGVVAGLALFAQALRSR